MNMGTGDALSIIVPLVLDVSYQKSGSFQRKHGREVEFTLSPDLSEFKYWKYLPLRPLAAIPV